MTRLYFRAHFMFPNRRMAPGIAYIDVTLFWHVVYAAFPGTGKVGPSAMVR